MAVEGNSTYKIAEEMGISRMSVHGYAASIHNLPNKIEFMIWLDLVILKLSLISAKAYNLQIIIN